jgi:hypothetical protein
VAEPTVRDRAKVRERVDSDVGVSRVSVAVNSLNGHLTTEEARVLTRVRNPYRAPVANRGFAGSLPDSVDARSCWQAPAPPS